MSAGVSFTAGQFSVLLRGNREVMVRVRRRKLFEIHSTHRITLKLEMHNLLMSWKVNQL